MALHHKSHSAAPAPAPKPTLPEPISSVDDRIANENIQMYEFRDDSNPSALTRFLWLLGSHRLAAIIAGVSLLTIVGVTGFAISHRSDGEQPTNPGTIAGSEDGDSTPVETFDYSDTTTTDQAGPQTGSDSSSGTGTAAVNPSAKKPAAPSGLTLKAQNYQIIASWKGVSGATQYEVQLSRSSSMGSPRQITSGSTTTVLSGLASATQYYVRVRAINSAGASTWTSIRNIKTTATTAPQPPLPSKVASLAVKINATNSITVSWGATANASRYSVTRATNSSMTSSRKEYASTSSRSYTVNDLKAGTKYYFTVRASNSRGYGPSSAVISAKTRIGATSISKLSLLSNNNVKVTVKSSTGASKYQVSYATASSFKGAKSVSSTSTTITVSGLKQGTKYYFRARAVDGSYSTSWSKSVSVKTKVLPQPFLLASFNIYYSSDASNHQYSEVQYLDRLTKSANVIKKHKLQVVGLQEVRKNQYQHILDPARLGSSYGIYPKSYAAGGYASQNPIVWDKSRFSLVDSGTKPIAGPHVGANGWFGSSNIQVHLKDKLTGQTFYVINTHETVGTSTANAKSRYTSAKNRVTYLKNLLKKDRPIFMTGDYNSHDYMPQKQPVYNNNFQNTAYCLFSKVNLLNAYDVLHGRTGCHKRNGSPVDHVYVSKGVQVSRYDYSSATARGNGSDVHNTLIVKVKMP